jgi:hypothetical protein
MRAGVVVMGVFVVLGCGRTVDEAKVSGVLLAPDGSPAANANVLLFAAAQVPANTLAASLGSTLDCLTPPAPAACANGQTTTTDATGAFSFTLNNVRVGVFAGETYELAAGLPASGNALLGPALARGVQLTGDTVTLGNLALWNPAFQVTDNGVAMRVDTLATGVDGGAAALGVWLTDAQQGLHWEQYGNIGVIPAPPAGVLEFPLEVLEDLDLHMAPVQWNNTGEDFLLRAETRSFSTSPGVPLSRGVSCTQHMRTGDVPRSFDCPVTDGRVATALTGCGPNALCSESLISSGFTVDLGTAQQLRVLVLRDARPTLVAETSVDGVTWTFLGNVSGHGVIRTVSGTLGRLIRVRASGGEDARFEQLRELSVW